MCQHSHFWSFVSRQKREQHFGLFYKFHWRLQTPAVSSALHASQKMSRFGRRAAAVRGRTGMTKCFLFFFPFFCLCWTCLHSSLLLCCHVVNKNMQKVSGWAAPRLWAAERRLQRAARLFGHTFVQSKSIFSHYCRFCSSEGGLILPQRWQRCKNKYSVELSREAANSQHSFLSGCEWKTIQQIMHEGPAEGEHATANTNRNYSLYSTCSIPGVCVSKQTSAAWLICSVFRKSGKATHLWCLKEPTEPPHPHTRLPFPQNNIPTMRTTIYLIKWRLLTVTLFSIGKGKWRRADQLGCIISAQKGTITQVYTTLGR